MTVYEPKTWATLVSSKDNLSESLSKLKNSNGKISEAEIKKWCQVKIKNVFISETDSTFVEIRNYCTFNNRDKLKGTSISEDLSSNSLQSDGQWTKANGRLKAVNDADLSPKMKEIKNRITDGAQQKDDKALKNWCETAYTEYFKGSDNQEFKDVESYCTTVP